MKCVVIVLHSVQPGLESEYEAAYDIHLREVAARPDVLRARRAEHVPNPGSPYAAPSQEFLTLYELETDDPAGWLGGATSAAESARASGEEQHPSPGVFMDESSRVVGVFQVVDEA
jgi:hypothetical protein